MDKKNIVKLITDIYKEIINVYSDELGFDFWEIFVNVREGIELNDGKNISKNIAGSFVVYLMYYGVIPKLFNLFVGKKNINDVALVGMSKNHLDVLNILMSNHKCIAYLAFGTDNRYMKQLIFRNKVVLIDGVLGFKDFMKIWKLKKKIKRITKKIMCENRLSKELIVLTSRIELYILNWYRFVLIGAILSKKSSKIIFGNDACHRAKGIIYSAKKMSVQTAVVQHGIIANVSKYLPSSDLMYVWGKNDYNKLVNAGVQSEKLIIAGYPYEMPSYLKPPRIGGDIIIAMTPFVEKKDVRQILDFFYEYSRTYGKVILRLHPLDQSDFSWIKCDEKFIIDNRDSLIKQINESQIGVIVSSSVAVPMALYGLKVIKLCLEGFGVDDTGYENYSFIKCVKNVSQLSDVLIEICDDDSSMSIYNYHRGLFLADYIAYGENDFSEIVLSNK